MVDAEMARTNKYFRPMRLGGGKGTTRRSKNHPFKKYRLFCLKKELKRNSDPKKKETAKKLFEKIIDGKEEEGTLGGEEIKAEIFSETIETIEQEIEEIIEIIEIIETTGEHFQGEDGKGIDIRIMMEIILAIELPIMEDTGEEGIIINFLEGRNLIGGFLM